MRPHPFVPHLRATQSVSREHRRAKTARLDTVMLMRVFLGWLRGERGHCGMVTIPTIEEEDAWRPCRERENLVGERTRITNRLKSDLTRLGIRGIKPAASAVAAHTGRFADPTEHTRGNAARPDPAGLTVIGRN